MLTRRDLYLEPPPRLPLTSRFPIPPWDPRNTFVSDLLLIL
jgi:hypothetical protein